MTTPSLSLAKANSVFSLALLKTLSKKDKTANIFYSPTSIASALSMVLLGAKGNTKREISKVLGYSEGGQPEESAEPQRQPMQMLQEQVPMGMFSSEDPSMMQMQQASTLPDCLRPCLTPQPDAPAAADKEVHAKFGELLNVLNNTDGPYDLSVANRLYGEETFKFIKGFLEDLEKYYKAELEAVDFINNAEGARVNINTWVEERTQGKIKDLMAEGSLSDLTRLVLVNAIYFKGKWKEPFKKEDTFDSTFRLTKVNSKPIKMMSQNSRFAIRSIPEVRIKVLEMPYDDGGLSMIFILPEDINDDTTGLEKLETELTHEKFVEWTRPDRMNVDKVEVQIPQFKLAETYDLKVTLEEMGIKEAFTSKSDLSGMSAVKGLVVSKVVHKAFLQVDEEGSEAAAATGITIELTSLPLDPPTFIADHPFLFFIRHNPSKSVIFAGRFCSPE